MRADARRHEAQAFADPRDVNDPVHPQSLVLVGYRGTGKSTVGRILAERLGLPFADADVELEALAGRPIPAIFAEQGEAAFRDWEERVLRRPDAPGPGRSWRPEGASSSARANRSLIKSLRLRGLADGRPRGAGRPVAGRPRRAGQPPRVDGRRHPGRDRPGPRSEDTLVSRGGRRHRGHQSAGPRRRWPKPSSTSGRAREDPTDGGVPLAVSLPVHLILGCGLFAIGTVVGSFLNVCIYRIPWQKSVIWPDSRCPKCLHAIAARDNIPIVSWLALRGACRHCGLPIAARYPAVEALVGLLFAGAYVTDVAFGPRT